MRGRGGGKRCEEMAKEGEGGGGGRRKSGYGRRLIKKVKRYKVMAAGSRKHLRK